MDHQFEPIVQIEGLVKNFGDLRAVNGLSMKVTKGIICGFLGPNGSGKSTTLRMITTLITPDAGSIRIFGKDVVKSRKQVLQKVGAIIERPNFYEHLTARKNLEILQQYSTGRKSAEKIDRALELVHLYDRQGSRVRTFSDGMKQRLGLAQALVNDPELLILDEPFNSLDPQGVKDMRELIKTLNRERGITVIVSSHNLDEIEKLCSHTILIKKGEVIARGEMSELVRRGKSSTIVSVDKHDQGKAILMSQFPSAECESLPNGDIAIMLHPEEVAKVAPVLVGHGVQVLGLRDNHTLESFFLSLAAE